MFKFLISINENFQRSSLKILSLDMFLCWALAVDGDEAGSAWWISPVFLSAQVFLCAFRCFQHPHPPCVCASVRAKTVDQREKKLIKKQSDLSPAYHLSPVSQPNPGKWHSFAIWTLKRNAINWTEFKLLFPPSHIFYTLFWVLQLNFLINSNNPGLF